MESPNVPSDLTVSRRAPSPRPQQWNALKCYDPDGSNWLPADTVEEVLGHCNKDSFKVFRSGRFCASFNEYYLSCMDSETAYELRKFAI